MNQSISILSVALLVANLFGFIRIVSAGSQCSWTGNSTTSSSWFRADNWACSSGGYPQANANVTISGGKRTPILNGNTTIESLALSYELDFSNNAVLTVTGGWSSPGGTLRGPGTIAGTGSISAGTLNASVTFDGDLTIQPPATLRVAASPASGVIVKGSVINNGTIDAEQAGGVFNTLGPKFTNNGAVDNVNFGFQRVGEQHLAGNGTWGQGAAITTYPNTYLTLDNSLSFNVHALSVSGSGNGPYVESSLNVGAYTLTLIGPIQFGMDFPCSVLGDGNIQVQGPAAISTGGGYFAPSLWIGKGADGIPNNTVSNISGSFSGPVTVAAEAEVDISNAGDRWGTSFHNLALYGVIREDLDSSLGLGGETVIIDGTITSMGQISLGSSSGSPLNISGKGSIQTDELSVLQGGANLGIPVTINRELLLWGGDLNSTGSGVTLSGEATTYNNYTQGNNDLWGTVRRNGPFTFGTSYSMGNPSLTITFSPIGLAATPPDAVTMKLTKGAPPDFASAVQRWYNFAVSGGTNWAATLHLRYLPIELGSNAENLLYLWGRKGTSPWEFIGRTSVASDGNSDYVEKTGLTTFSDVAIASRLLLFLPVIIR